VVRMRKSRPVLQEAAALFPWTALVLPTPVLTANETENQTTAPIEHLVVIIEEKASLDPSVAVYPYAPNPAGEPQFHAWHGSR